MRRLTKCVALAAAVPAFFARCGVGEITSSSDVEGADRTLDASIAQKAAPGSAHARRLKWRQRQAELLAPSHHAAAVRGWGFQIVTGCS